jgi:hypothetical protein
MSKNILQRFQEEVITVMNKNLKAGSFLGIPFELQETKVHTTAIYYNGFVFSLIENQLY